MNGPAVLCHSPAPETTRFFDSESEARAYHADMRDQGRKPRTTKIVNHKLQNGTPVYSWKVTTFAKGA